jgi:hypothetical protein
MSERSPKRASERIYPRVPPHLAQRLAKNAAASGMSETAVVIAALEQYLDRTSDTVLVMARLDRLGRAQERAHRDQQLHAEAFASYVRMWFAQTPPLPPDARKAALKDAEARFGQFLQYVAQQVSRGNGFFDQFPRERVADDEDLARAAATEPLGGASGSKQGE